MARCDRGTLASICQTQRVAVSYAREVLQVCLDISLAGMYLHKHDVIHGAAWSAPKSSETLQLRLLCMGVIRRRAEYGFGEYGFKQEFSEFFPPH